MRLGRSGGVRVALLPRPCWHTTTDCSCARPPSKRGHVGTKLTLRRSCSTTFGSSTTVGWVAPTIASKAVMEVFEIIIALLLAGAGLTALSRHLGTPYPALVALAGAALALIPGTPTLVLEP